MPETNTEESAPDNTCKPTIIDDGMSEKISNDHDLDHTNSRSEGDFWSIGVKTLATNANSSDFTVLVNPNDDLEQLFNQIENKTGLPAAQQRLIYRGRLIEDKTNSSTPGGTINSRTNYDKSHGKGTSSQAGTSKKIKDIAGLTDGHTIHLVERKIKPTDGATTPSTQNTSSRQQSSSSNESAETNAESNGASSTGAASLLAALLGMGNSGSDSGGRVDDDDDDEETDNNVATTTAASNVTTSATASMSRPRWRPRPTATRRRHLSYRLTEDDLRIQDPGSMESVRQGLLTLHTLFSASSIEPVETDSNNNENDSNSHYRFQQVNPNTRSPLDAQRRFFRGQWIDLRDTVNQWLEATIVDIVVPEDILAAPIPNRPRRRIGPTTISATDPAVSANDTDGRRKLLLEGCSEEEHDPSLGIELDAHGEPIYFRQRETNEGVQLLLVHYNGWPHRWDEWIRSDSERIRPFRTRTRHPGNNQRISPTVQSPFSESPSTNFVQNNNINPPQHNDAREQVDRQFLLPELSRVMTVVNDLVADASTNVAELSNLKTDSTLPSQATSTLPWACTRATTDPNENRTILEGQDEDDEELDECKQPAIEDFSSTPNNDKNTSVKASRATLRRRRQELETLAPLLDRLGRILVDAAPQVAALAASLDQTTESVDDQRRAASLRPVSSGHDGERQPSTLGSFLSLLSRERRHNSVGSNSAVILGNDSASNTNSQEQTTVASASNRDDDDDVTDAETIYEVQVDPDYTDFATGLVNTTRGDVRGGGSRSGHTNRQSSVGSASDELAGLLGAYLAAASLGNLVSSSDDDDADNTGSSTPTNNTAQGLGRILRERGVGGNGIDIHIHAVVTAPGGNVGLATLGGTGLGTAALFRNATERATSTSYSSPTQVHEPQVLQEDDDDLGIFAELYSETPEPIDPSSPSAISVAVASNDGDEADQQFESTRDDASTNEVATSAYFTPSTEVEGSSSSSFRQVTISSPPPHMFSRNSRRSGFVSSTSVNSLNNQTNFATTSNSSITSTDQASQSSLYQLSPNNTTNNSTANNNHNNQGRQNRGNVLSRLFRRSNQDGN